MITGHNTDVRHRECDLHVQTEDKGTRNPYVESLIYRGGQVVASRRTDYSELLEKGAGRPEIMALIDRQHRKMIEALKAGEFDSKLPSAGSNGASKPSASQKVQAPPGPTGSTRVEIEEDTGEEVGLDDLILDFLASEIEQEQLVLALGKDPDWAQGEHEVLVRANASQSGRPLAGVQVIARMVSTRSGPIILGEGRTDADGCTRIAVSIDEASRGNSALILTGCGELGTAELKYLL